ncbi:MAG: 50S ribosomal protein L21 [Nitrososphaerales archaeon]|nr:50S ribosomal protein L21 [Nitrososphaerales archaeon]
MMPRSKGFRRRTRSLLIRRGSKGLTPLLHEYKVKDKVVINIDSSQVKGMPHRRYQGLVGIVEEVRRRSLMIEVPVGGKIKRIIARFEHIKPHAEGLRSEQAIER